MIFQVRKPKPSLFIVIEHAWPKCGPPKIFCGPWVKFWMHLLTIKTYNYVSKTPKIDIDYVTVKRKMSQKKFCGPQFNFLLNLARENKSVHPYYIVTSAIFLWSTLTLLTNPH